MARRALVLGGGGSVGIAWETGLAAGLADEGIDLRLADKIVGTSAGSFVGAELASGRSPEEMRTRLTEGAKARAESASSADGNAMPAPDLTKLMQFMMRMPKNEAEALKLRAEIGAYALEAETIPEESCIGFFASVADTPWPAKYACTAVDALDGRFVVLDQSTKTELARGVASSCSVPGLFPPITINGRRYVDGGMRSATNFDLAEGFERVIAVAVIPPGAAAFMAARIDPELAQLRRSGSHVELIAPDAASLDAFGINLMDASRQIPAMEAGYKQGRAEAVRIRSVWA
jgi:NTE family protein